MGKAVRAVDKFLFGAQQPLSSIFGADTPAPAAPPPAPPPPPPPPPPAPVAPPPPPTPVAPPAAPPTPDQKAIDAAGEKARKKRGRASTIATSPLGITEDSFAGGGQRTLLG